MESNAEELLEETIVTQILITDNPCGLADGLMGALREVLHSFIGKHCVQGASKEQVARYLQRDVRTITRWSKEYDDFPKGSRGGHKELEYNWFDIIKWKLKHKDIWEQ